MPARPWRHRTEQGVDPCPPRSPSPSPESSDRSRRARRPVTCSPDDQRGPQAVVVARVDGELRDLAHVARPTATWSSRCGSTSRTAWRSCATRPRTCWPRRCSRSTRRPGSGIGPPVRDGFYYDFDVRDPFTPEDLKALEKAMQRDRQRGPDASAAGSVTDDEARARAGRRALQARADRAQGRSRRPETEQATEGADAEVGGGELTIYDNVRRDGSLAWRDLCRGPHLPTTKLISNAFGLMRSRRRLLARQREEPAAAAHLRHRVADQGRRSRPTWTGWPRPSAATTARSARSSTSSPSPTSSARGWPSSTPRAAILRKAMEDYSRQRHEESGYEFVYTPHITKAGALRDLRSPRLVRATACSRRCTSTRSTTRTAPCASRARTTTSSR